MNPVWSTPILRQLMKLMKSKKTKKAVALIDKGEVVIAHYLLDQCFTNLIHLSPPHQVHLGHALFFAALLGRVQIVQTLLEKGAKVVILRTQSKFAHISNSPFSEKVVMAYALS